MLENKQDRLISLAGKLLDECISAAEAEELNVLLRESECRRLFVEFSHLHCAMHQAQVSSGDAALAQKLKSVHDAIIPLAVIGDESLEDAGGFSAGTHHYASPVAAVGGDAAQTARGSLLKNPWLIGLASAACTAFVLLALDGGQDKATSSAANKPSMRHNKPGKSGQDPSLELSHAIPEPQRAKSRDSSPARAGFVARVVATTEDLVWDEQGAPHDFLMRLRAGSRVVPQAGLVEIEFSQGASFILQGPAHLEIIGPAEARLEYGNLTGRSDVGSFLLRTPASDVVDIGTLFGVSVGQDGTTDVGVFEGEVHVTPSVIRRPANDPRRLTTGMSIRINAEGAIVADAPFDEFQFQKALPHVPPATLGKSEISLVDVISGSQLGEYRIAGSIDPDTGYWGEAPWLAAQGVPLRDGRDRFIPCPWNEFIDGVFVPLGGDGDVIVDSAGHHLSLSANCGTTWGPVWARRRLDLSHEPLAQLSAPEDQEFWGAGSTMAMLDRLDWARDGLVGIHANVGLTIDLGSIRKQSGCEIVRFRGVVAHLEMSRESAPLYPHARADFRVLLDGDLVFRRLGFRRSDGDAQLGVSIDAGDRYLTLLSTDADGTNEFDHIILIDPVLELSTSKAAN